MTGHLKNGCLILGVLAACLAAGGTLAAGPPQKVASGLYPTKELLVLMDQDRNGKVSRDEFMKFMAASSTRWTPIMTVSWTFTN